jgi:hypothetical protein
LVDRSIERLPVEWDIEEVLGKLFHLIFFLPEDIHVMSPYLERLDVEDKDKGGDQRIVRQEPQSTDFNW